MDITRKDPKNLAARAKAEKYAKILAKTIVNPDGDDSNRGQNAFFYDAAEGLLTSVILMLAEFLPPDEEHPQERRHIVSVFKLVQDLLEPSKVKGKSHFQLLMGKLPPDHKARWFAGAALNSAEQAMASVMSTVLSRLNAFLDSELEQVLCFDSVIDAEKFAYGEILVNLPMKVLCGENCKGICNRCGTNLNHGNCGCDTTGTDPRMAKALEVFNSFKEV